MLCFFNDTATTEIYTLSLHDALPISPGARRPGRAATIGASAGSWLRCAPISPGSAVRSQTRGLSERNSARSEEHPAELQSPHHPVSRLLLGKKTKADRMRCAH